MNKVVSSRSDVISIEVVALGDEVGNVSKQCGEVEVERGRKVFLDCAEKCGGDCRAKISYFYFPIKKGLVVKFKLTRSRQRGFQATSWL